MMQNSQLNSLTIPVVGSQNPATLYKAAQIPIRLAILNTGPNLVFLSHDSSTLNSSPVFANTYRLPAGKEIVIVLAPQQGIFAVSLGVGGVVSVAASEAIPVI